MAGYPREFKKHSCPCIVEALHCPTIMEILTNFRFHGRVSGCSLIFLIRQTITLFYIITTLYGQICNAQVRPMWPRPMCNGKNYTKGSVEESNLNTVLNNLVQHTHQTGFNTSVYGQWPDQKSGLLQCNGDATSQQCYNCSQQAVSDVRQYCENAVGGRVWLEHCYVRYEGGNNFIGKLNNDSEYVTNPLKVSSSGVFNAAVERLLKNLSGRTESGSRFAAGTTSDSLSRKIYGLVQCTKDISSDDCTKCLSYAVQDALTFSPESEGVEALLGSCRARYQNSSFFDTTAEAPANTVAIPPAPSSNSAEAPANTVAIPPAPSSNSTTQMKHSGKAPNKIPITLGAAVGGFLVILFVCLFACRRRLKSAIIRSRHEGHGQHDNDTLLDDRQIVFSMETLVAATANFHEDNKLGEGGFGPVFKGITEDGKHIAVKKLSLTSRQGRKEFLNEVKLVAQIQHRNLVDLLGCCVQGSERLLVYEYLPNKSLDRFLFDPIKRADLDWQKRKNIVLGIARGLLYLHQDSRLRIVHRDIKASNILLDEQLNPKIADFGLAKLFPEDETHVSTRIAGTLGYMAPEYALRGQLSVKADVYSFGVVLLELVTGRKNTDYNLSSEMEMLLGWVWNSYRLGNLAQTIDPTIVETCEEGQVLRCIHVGLLCTQADSSLRPPMSTVVLMLSTPSEMLPDPTKPAYLTSVTQNTNFNDSGSGLSHESAPIIFPVSSSHNPVVLLSNDDTITDLEPR